MLASHFVYGFLIGCPFLYLLCLQCISFLKPYIYVLCMVVYVFARLVYVMLPVCVRVLSWLSQLLCVFVYALFTINVLCMVSFSFCTLFSYFFLSLSFY